MNFSMDWKNMLAPYSRQRVIYGMMQAFQRFFPFDEEEGALALGRRVMETEENIYIAATNKADYARKLCLSMLELITERRAAAQQQQQQVQHNMDPQLLDWRASFQLDSRRRIVKKLAQCLKKHLPYSGELGMQHLRRSAERLEELAYNAATTRFKYLRRVAVKMLMLEYMSQRQKERQAAAIVANNGRVEEEAAARVDLQDETRSVRPRRH